MLFIAGNLPRECGGATIHTGAGDQKMTQAALEAAPSIAIVTRETGTALQLAGVRLVGPCGSRHAVRGEWDNGPCGLKTVNGRVGCRLPPRAICAIALSVSAMASRAYGPRWR